MKKRTRVRVRFWCGDDLIQSRIKCSYAGESSRLLRRLAIVGIVLYRRAVVVNRGRLTVLLFRGRLRDGLYETGDIHAMIFCLSVFVHRRTRIHCCQDVYPGLGLDAQLVEEWDKSRRYGDFKVDPAAAALGLGIGNPMSYVEKNFAVGLLAQRRSVVEPVADKGVGNER